uniref:WAP domain-containing protein n=1 Tax=Salarias fasciatus TaxID=181472 RepID=A0A672FAJ1_SALFA
APPWFIKLIQDNRYYSKPGQCPQADLRFGKKCRSWRAGCSGDDQCSGIRKCCRIGCRYLCITPGELWIK